MHPRRGLSTDFSSPWAPVVRSCKCVRLKEQMERNMGKGKQYQKHDGNATETATDDKRGGVTSVNLFALQG